jgi:hypothetical protein
LDKDKKMRNIVIFSFVTLGFLSPALAQNAEQQPCIGCAQSQEPFEYPAPAKGYCFYNGRIYSPGAFLCIADGTANRCGSKGAEWTLEAAPACKISTHQGFQSD